MKKSAIVYWLIPEQHERELFTVLIRILARQFDAPRFQPHMTIMVAAQRHSPRSVLRQIKASPIRLKIRGVAFSARFTKTLFVRMKSTKTIEKLSVDLGKALKSQVPPCAHAAPTSPTLSKRLHDPHVSLLYKKMPSSVKKELASTIKLPFREVSFDSIQAVRCVLPVTNRGDVESWRVVAAKKLATR